VEPDHKLVARIWECEDDCGCSQAQIYEVIERNDYGGVRDSRTVWAGKYRHEWEPGATADLNRVAARLRKQNRALRRRISWPWDRK
jgi:hypothetical protein